MLRTILSWLTGGILNRVLSTVDKRIEAQTDREKIKGDIIKEHYRSRGDWMRAGGFWLTMLFAVPLALHFAAVIFYSILFCHRCAFPQGWTIAALPPPLDEWSWAIIMSIFGVVAADRWGRR